MAEESNPARSIPPWWEEWAGRLEAELQRFTDLDLPYEIVEDPRAGGDRLIIASEAPGDDGAVPVKVVYPDGYPFRRFQIFSPGLDLPRHQSPSGDLCVLARDASYWTSGNYAADFVAIQVPKLIRLVRAGGDELRDAEDPQGEPVTSYYGGLFSGGVVVDDHAHAIDFATHTSGIMWYRASSPDIWMLPQQPSGRQVAGQAIVTTLVSSSGTVLSDCSNEPVAQRIRTEAREGRWVYLADPPLTDNPEVLWARAAEQDPSLDRWVRNASGIRLVGVCVREETGQGVFGPSWVFLARQVSQPAPYNPRKRSGSPAVRAASNQVSVSAAVILRGLRWTEEAMASRIPGLSALPERTVSLVGLGSLGTPVAQELVKARVGTLRVLDSDYVDPGTSVRYPLGLTDAGLPKPSAFARWAEHHNPAVLVEPEALHIGGQSLDTYYNERARLSAFLGGSDLMVNATAELDISRQLDRMAVHLGIPRLHLWGIAGYGGIVALLREGVTGCFHCLELEIKRMSDDGTPAVAVPTTEVRIQAPGCADQTFAATHPDLLPISIQAASVAFGELSRDSGGYEPFDDDFFTVQTRAPSGQRIAPAWRSHRLPPNPECTSCSSR